MSGVVPVPGIPPTEQPGPMAPPPPQSTILPPVPPVPAVPAAPPGPPPFTTTQPVSQPVPSVTQSTPVRAPAPPQPSATTPSSSNTGTGGGSVVQQTPTTPATAKGASLLSVSSVFLPAKYKVVFLGDMSVGKTSIITRFMYNTFDKQEHTIGIDFLSKTLTVDHNRTIRLQLWDTAGQERYRSLISSYIRESQAAVLVYDITVRQSFDAIGRWLDDVRKQCGNDVVLALVGNKTDLAAKRAVTKEEGEAKAAEWKALFFETSAKTGSSIQTVFTKLATALPVSAASAPLQAPQVPFTPLPAGGLGGGPGAGGPFALTGAKAPAPGGGAGMCRC